MLEFVSICLTTLLSYAALFLTGKVIGHKQISQLDFLDYITGITIGSIAAELATNLEEFWKPLTALVLYGGLTALISWINLRFQRSRKYLNGTPTILLDRGRFYRENMKKAKLELSEFMVMCRQQGYFDVSAIETAVFEYNGKLTILPVSDRRPVTPQDLNLRPAQERLFTEVILDGRILEENLQRRGLNRGWLEKQLKKQGFQQANEVFLGLCDDQNNLACYQTSP